MASRSAQVISASSSARPATALMVSAWAREATSGEDATVLGVQVNLGGDDVGADGRPASDDGGGSFVAGSFDGEDDGHAWIVTLVLACADV